MDRMAQVEKYREMPGMGGSVLPQIAPGGKLAAD
jgi:hypothetical protein